MILNLKDGLTITDIIAILAGIAVVIKAIYEVVSLIRNLNKDEKDCEQKTKEILTDTNVKAATLYREALDDISCLRKELKELREEYEADSEKFKKDINQLKNTLEQKDREYLVLKQDLAEKNELIEKQQEAISMANRLHAKWEKGIQKLLEQMDRNQIKPEWTPGKEK